MLPTIAAVITWRVITTVITSVTWRVIVITRRIIASVTWRIVVVRGRCFRANTACVWVYVPFRAPVIVEVSVRITAIIRRDIGSIAFVISANSHCGVCD